jgi:hypothetical protein
MERLRQGTWVTWIPKGHGSDGFPILRNRKDPVRFLDIEASHLVDEQSTRVGFKSQLSGGTANVVKSVPIRFAVASHYTVGDRQSEHWGLASPMRIEFNQNANESSKICRVLFCGHDVGPRLLI